MGIDGNMSDFKHASHSAVTSQGHLSKEFNLSNVKKKQELANQRRLNLVPKTNQRNSKSLETFLRYADSSSDGSFSDTSEENDHFDQLMKQATDQQLIVKHSKNQKVKRPLPSNAGNEAFDIQIEESKQRQVPDSRPKRKLAIAQ